jgi:DNA-binding XRE family transcriptional regulator
MENKGKRLIYSLRCPFTDDVHYVGKATNGMTRPLQHLSVSHSSKVKEWVENLKELGHSPSIKILETVSEIDDIDGRERYWITHFLNKGNLLLNDVLITPITISRDLDEVLSEPEGKEMEIIGRFVKERRKMVGITQPDFADKCGIALTVLRKIEQGKSNITLDGLFTVLKMFGATLEVTKIKRN